jgi:polynucleotide 5'-kinase involved in rRNA processing
MFNRLMKDDLVAYSDSPKSIPLGIVKSIEEKKGKAVVMVYVLDTFLEDEIGTVKCVPYHKLDLVARGERV